MLYLTHGRPVIAMMDGFEPVEVQALRLHLRALSDDPDLVEQILGPDDCAAVEGIERARALRLARAWGRPHPGGDA